jgi:outer membrane lipoprotein-sorting protein
MKTMKHTLGLFFLSCFLMAAFVLPAQAQDNKADEIISKYLDARGGVDNIKGTQSLKQVGEVNMPAMGMVMPVVIYQERPSKVRSEVEVNANGMEMEIISGYDGTVGWAINPMAGGGVQEVPEEQMGSMKNQADMDGPLVDYADKGNMIEYVGEEEVNGVNTHKIKLTQADSSETFLFFDPETHMQVKSEGIGPNPMTGAEAQVETFYADYREVEGVMRPFKIEMKIDGQVMQMITMMTVEANQDIDDTLFAKPD